MGTFDRNKGSEQITFQKVIDSYGSSPVEISEVFTPGTGWYKPVNSNNPTKEFPTVDDIYELATNCEVFCFNFGVVDQFGVTKYPDFYLSELVN